jgi:hypothetical protein
VFDTIPFNNVHLRQGKEGLQLEGAELINERVSKLVIRGLNPVQTYG